VIVGTERGTAASGIIDAIRHTIEGVSVRSVFGEPVQQGDTTVIPVARISGRGGGGGGSGGGSAGGGPGGGPGAGQPGQGGGGPGGSGDGSGGGLALRARPAGVFALRDGQVRWRPAVDVNMIIAGGQLVMVAAVLAAKAIAVSRRRHRR
jgi:uncharacterized spore protein YtfJ